MLDRGGDDLGRYRPGAAGGRDWKERRDAGWERMNGSEVSFLEEREVRVFGFAGSHFIPERVMMPLLAVLAETGADEKKGFGGAVEGTTPAAGIFGSEFGSRGQRHPDGFESGQLRA